MIKEEKEKIDLSLDKLSELLKNPPQNVYVQIYTKKRVEVESVKRPSEKMTLAKLAEEMRAGFKQVNDRIDKIDARLDYIVKANNLKDLPRSK